MRVLVSAASKHGSTAEIAEAIAAALRTQGHEVTVGPPEQVRSVDAYDGVVLGSAVYLGRWMPASVELAQRLQDELRRRPVWVFSSGPVGERGDEPSADAAKVATLVGARESRVFAGRVERSELGMGERAVLRMVHAPVGDFRDWDAISAWAHEIGAALDAIPHRAGSRT